MSKLPKTVVDPIQIRRYPSQIQNPGEVHRRVLKEVATGQIVTEIGGDGVYLRFECDCQDALPYCKAACCNLAGILVKQTELDATAILRDFQEAGMIVKDSDNDMVMKRGSDGWCMQNDPITKLCTCYPDRPGTCRDFHCTKGADMRGFQLTLKRIGE